MSDRQYGPSIQLTKLWEKVSEKGTRYFVGRLAGAKITMLPNRDKTSDTDADWVILLSQAEPYTPRTQAGQPPEPVSRDSGADARSQAAMPLKQPRAPARRSRSRYAGEPGPAIVDDPMPF